VSETDILIKELLLVALRGLTDFTVPSASTLFEVRVRLLETAKAQKAWLASSTERMRMAEDMVVSLSLSAVLLVR